MTLKKVLTRIFGYEIEPGNISPNKMECLVDVFAETRKSLSLARVFVVSIGAFSIGQQIPIEIIPENLWGIGVAILIVGYALKYLVKRVKNSEEREKELISSIIADKDKAIDDKNEIIKELQDMLLENNKKK